MIKKILAILVLTVALTVPAIAQDEPQIDDAISEDVDVDEIEPSGPIQIVVVEPPTPIVIVVTATAEATAVPIDTPTPAPTPTAVLTERGQMATMLSATVISWISNPAMPTLREYSPSLWVMVEFTNTGNEGLRAYSGVLSINDLFGRTLKETDLSVDDHPLTPGQTARDLYTIRLNQFIASDTRIRDAAKDSLTFVFEPRSLIFADGRRIGTAAGLR